MSEKFNAIRYMLPDPEGRGGYWLAIVTPGPKGFGMLLRERLEISPKSPQLAAFIDVLGTQMSQWLNDGYGQEERPPRDILLFLSTQPGDMACFPPPETPDQIAHVQTLASTLVPYLLQVWPEWMSAARQDAIDSQRVVVSRDVGEA